MDHMNSSWSGANGCKCKEQLRDIDDMSDPSSELKALDAMNNSTLLTSITQGHELNALDVMNKSRL